MEVWINNKNTALAVLLYDSISRRVRCASGTTILSPAKKSGYLKRTPTIFSFKCHFLLLLQKKVTKEQGVRKRQPPPVCPPATQAIKAPPNRARFTPFPACPRTS